MIFGRFVVNVIWVSILISMVFSGLILSSGITIGKPMIDWRSADKGK